MAGDGLWAAMHSGSGGKTDEGHGLPRARWVHRAYALGLALLCAQPACARAEVPLRVMSINVCADQLVLALLPPQRITSVSWVARDDADSYLARAAARVPANHGTAEEVLRQHPDLVIAGTYTTTATRVLLRSVHYPLLEVAPAESFEDIRAVTRRIGAAVGATEAAESLIARMDAQLAWLAAHPPGRRFRVAVWNAGGASPGRGTLYDAVLTAAGAVNVVTEAGYRSFDTEELMRSAPDLLVQGASGFSKPGRRDDVVRHPLVLAYWGERSVTIPESLYTCGTPFSAEAALRLRRALEERSAVARRPLPYVGSVQ
ncbi:MAG: ABC transporter substrate-binding protein [Proteobacteria bacterium]|nr:ABC transporter substrate-binding protein [Pseudomonadota bacterium]